MRRFLLVAVVSAAPARAPPTPPPAPAAVCVPRDLLERLATATASRPWVDVAPLMAELVPALQKPVACAMAPAPVQPPPASAADAKP